MRYAILAIAVGFIFSGCGADSHPSESDIDDLYKEWRRAIGAYMFMGASEIEFGKAIISQGGSREMSVDAQKGSQIFPLQINRNKAIAYERDDHRYWVFKDSFGKLKLTLDPYQ